MQPCLALLCPVILSLSSRASSCLTTSALVLLFVSSPPHPSLTLVYPHILLISCPYHFNVLSCIFLDVSRFPSLEVFRSVFISVTPHVHLDIFISATSNSFSWAFLTAHELPTSVKHVHPKIRFKKECKVLLMTRMKEKEEMNVQLFFIIFLLYFYC